MTDAVAAAGDAQQICRKAKRYGKVFSTLRVLLDSKGGDFLRELLAHIVEAITRYSCDGSAKGIMKEIMIVCEKNSIEGLASKFHSEESVKPVEVDEAEQQPLLRLEKRRWSCPPVGFAEASRAADEKSPKLRAVRRKSATEPTFRQGDDFDDGSAQADVAVRQVTVSMDVLPTPACCVPNSTSPVVPSPPSAPAPAPAPAAEGCAASRANVVISPPPSVEGPRAEGAPGAVRPRRASTVSPRRAVGEAVESMERAAAADVSRKTTPSFADMLAQPAEFSVAASPKPKSMEGHGRELSSIQACFPVRVSSDKLRRSNSEICLSDTGSYMAVMEILADRASVDRAEPGNAAQSVQRFRRLRTLLLSRAHTEGECQEK